jgi:hypothetical protein
VGDRFLLVKTPQNPMHRGIFEHTDLFTDFHSVSPNFRGFHPVSLSGMIMRAMSTEPKDDFDHDDGLTEIERHDLLFDSRKNIFMPKQKPHRSQTPQTPQTSASFPFMSAAMAEKESAQGAARTMAENKRKQAEEAARKAELIEEQIAIVYPKFRKDLADAIAARCNEGMRGIDFPIRHEHAEHVAQKLGAELVALDYHVSSPFMKDMSKDPEYGDMVWHITVSW